MLHYKPENGYFGDPIPFFWDGVYHLFYLIAPLEPKRNGADFTSYAHVSSRDLVHWHEHSIAISPTEGGPDALSCWTGSIIEKDGTFYLFYTGHGRGIYKWPQTICMATSPDLEHWTKCLDNPIMTPDPEKYQITDWRDPFVFWCEQEQCYLMSITTMRKGANFWKAGSLVMARSTDLIHWNVGEVYYHPGNHGYPECSDLFEMGGRWYMVSSIFHKTYYRVADSPLGPWRAAHTDSFDSVLNYAIKTISDGCNRFVIGWIRTKYGLNDDGPWEWAGNMAFPRQIVQEADGSLMVKLPRAFDSLRQGCLFDLEQHSQCEAMYGQWERTSEGMLLDADSLFGQVAVPGEYPSFDLDLEFTLAEGATSGGLIFHADGQEHPGYEVAVDLRQQVLIFRKHTDRFHFYVYQNVDIRPGEKIRMRVIVEGTIVEAFVNDRYSLSSRFYHQPARPAIAFYAEDGGALLSAMKIHKLAASPDEIEEEPERRENVERKREVAVS